ncbi:MAG: RDD family protein [Phycisphaerae bacterium]
MRYLLLLLAALTAALGAGCDPLGTETPAAAPRVLAAGNRNNLYVLVTARVDGADGFRFWQRDAAGLWHAGEPARGTPAALAAWREHLLVFFPSGRWGRFGLDRPSVHPAPVPAWTPAAACEDGLAADAFGTMTTGDAALLRFSGGAWSAEPEIVEGVDAERVLAPQLARFGGRLFVVWCEDIQDFPGSGAPYRLRFAIRDADGTWQRPLSSRLRVASPAHVAAAEQEMVCLYRKPGEDGPSAAWFLATYATADEDWHEAGPVQGAQDLESLSLAADGDGFVVAVLDGRRPSVARLDVGAPALDAFAPVPTQKAAGRAEEPFSWAAAAVMAGLAFLLVMLALRGARRQAMMGQEAGTEAGHVAATLWRRGLAVALDYLLILGGTALVLAAVAPSLAHTMERIMETGEMEWRNVLLLEGVRLAVMIVYFTLAEGRTGRTLGKALLGIEVRTVAGETVTLRQAAVRSVLRPIDELPTLYLLGLVFIVRGPRPQRLGDRAADTLVVRRTARPAA